MNANFTKQQIQPPNHNSNKNLLIITPGIRLPGDSYNDQKRIMTPNNAFENKVSGIVIGRSLTKGNIKNNIIRLLDHLNK